MLRLQVLPISLVTVHHRRWTRSIGAYEFMDMLLRDYVNERLDEGESNAMLERLMKKGRSSLDQAVKHVPALELHAEISDGQKEADG